EAAGGAGGDRGGEGEGGVGAGAKCQRRGDAGEGDGGTDGEVDAAAHDDEGHAERGGADDEGVDGDEAEVEEADGTIGCEGGEEKDDQQQAEHGREGPGERADGCGGEGWGGHDPPRYGARSGVSRALDSGVSMLERSMRPTPVSMCVSIGLPARWSTAVRTPSSPMRMGFWRMRASSSPLRRASTTASEASKPMKRTLPARPRARRARSMPKVEVSLGQKTPWISPLAERRFAAASWAVTRMGPA